MTVNLITRFKNIRNVNRFKNIRNVIYSANKHVKGARFKDDPSASSFV